MAVVPGRNLVGEGVPELGVTKAPPVGCLTGVLGAGAAGADGAGCIGLLALGAEADCVCIGLPSALAALVSVLASRHALATHLHSVISSR